MINKKLKYLCIILFYSFHTQNSNTDLDKKLIIPSLKEYITTISKYKKTIGTIIVLCVICIAYILNSKKENPEKIIDLIKKELSPENKINIQKIENSANKIKQFKINTPEDKENPEKIIDLIKKELSPENKINIQKIENSANKIKQFKINTPEDFENFLNQLNDLLDYIKNLRKKIDNRKLNDLLEITIPIKLTTCLINEEKNFNTAFFQKYLNFIKKDNLEYTEKTNIYDKPNHTFYYYDVLCTLWVATLDYGRKKLTASCYECLLKLPLEKSWMNECKYKKLDFRNYSYNILEMIYENYITKREVKKSKKIYKLYEEKKKYLEDEIKIYNVKLDIFCEEGQLLGFET